jgi:hypothetical protein
MRLERLLEHLSHLLQDAAIRAVGLSRSFFSPHGADFASSAWSAVVVIAIDELVMTTSS